MWQAAQTLDTAHLMPVDDLVNHDHSEDCVCGPTFKLVQRPGLSDGHLYTHHALDDREAPELGGDAAPCC